VLVLPFKPENADFANLLQSEWGRLSFRNLETRAEWLKQLCGFRSSQKDVRSAAPTESYSIGIHRYLGHQ
jgi:hypothetical protein